MRAVGQGNSFVGYDMPRTTRGFRFSGHGLDQGIMGDCITMNGRASLQAQAPAEAVMRLIRHGEIVAEVENGSVLNYKATEPGAYRVECEIEYHGRNRGWIYSNPIYLIQ